MTERQVVSLARNLDFDRGHIYVYTCTYNLKIKNRFFLYWHPKADFNFCTVLHVFNLVHSRVLHQGHTIVLAIFFLLFSS